MKKRIRVPRATLGGLQAFPPVADEAARSVAAAELLAETDEFSNVPTTLSGPQMTSVNVDQLRRLEEALRGHFSAYHDGAHDHPVLLVLSELVRLRKRHDAVEKLVRFLVARSDERS